MISSSEFLNLKIPTWVKFVVLILIGLIIVAAIRGCNNSNASLAETKELKRKNDSLSKKIVYDSLDRIQSKKEYETTIQTQDGIISINENKWIATSKELDAANDRIQQLLGRYKPIQPNTDTNITTVSNTYIQDCADCFTELSGQVQQTVKAKADMNNLKISLTDKIKTQDNRINELGKENRNLSANLNASQSIIKQYSDKLESRRRLLLTLSTIAINHNYPTGIGAGFIYQDKKYRLYGLNAYGTNVGPIYTASYSLPLSLRFIK